MTQHRTDDRPGVGNSWAVAAWTRRPLIRAHTSAKDKKHHFRHHNPVIQTAPCLRSGPRPTSLTKTSSPVHPGRISLKSALDFLREFACAQAFTHTDRHRETNVTEHTTSLAEAMDGSWWQHGGKMSSYVHRATSRHANYTVTTVNWSNSQRTPTSTHNNNNLHSNNVGPRTHTSAVINSRLVKNSVTAMLDVPRHTRAMNQSTPHSLPTKWCINSPSLLLRSSKTLIQEDGNNWSNCWLFGASCGLDQCTYSPCYFYQAFLTLLQDRRDGTHLRLQKHTA